MSSPANTVSGTASLLNNNGRLRTLVIVTVAASTGTVIGFATALFCMRFRKKSFDFVRLNEDVMAIKKELENLQSSVQKLQIQTDSVASAICASRKSKLGLSSTSQTQSIMSSTPSQASLDAYFDASAALASESSSVTGATIKSDGEISPLAKKLSSKPEIAKEAALLDDELGAIMKISDDLQVKESDEARAKSYELLKANYSKGKENPSFLCRYAMACYLYGQTFHNRDQNKRKALCIEAQKYAFEALKYKDDDADIHKWCALTLGVMSDFVSMKQKIEDGHKFKLHIDRAMQLKPDDAVLHHLCGRWCFGVASLTWFERRIASTLFAKPPDSTYDDALKQFLEADRLKPNWLENILYIVKVFLALSKADEVKRWIRKAEKVKAVSADDHASKKEMESILSKYD